MRYPASEKIEIINLVEGSHLPAKATLTKLGIPRATFYRWYGRFLTGGPEALARVGPAAIVPYVACQASPGWTSGFRTCGAKPFNSPRE